MAEDTQGDVQEEEHPRARVNRRSADSDQRVKPGVVILIIRWVARIWSAVTVGFVLLILFGEVLFPHAPAPTFRDLVGMFFFPFGVCAGMLLAWRWEAVGGGITVGSLLAFYVTLRIMKGRFPGGPFFPLIAAPGFLFLLSSGITVARKRRSGAEAATR